MNRLGEKISKWVPWGIAVLTVSVTCGLALNISPYLRGPDSWRWAYALPGMPWRHLIPLVVVKLYGITMALVLRRIVRSPASRWATGGFLVAACVSVPVIQMSLLAADARDVLQPLLYRTISPGASGVFTVGSWIQSPWDFLRTYPARMPTFPVHPQRYPPGLVMLFYYARRLIELAPSMAGRLAVIIRPHLCHNLELMALPDPILATAFLQMLLPVICGLVVFPLYGLAKEVANRRVALLAVLLYPLVPSFALWSGRWDQFYPLLTCTVFYLFCGGLNRDRKLLLGIAGGLLGLGTMLSFGLVTMLMPLGLIGVLWSLPHPERRRWSRLVSSACVFAAGLVLPWLIYQCVVGNGFLDIWRVSMSYHLGLTREYWVWLGYHLYDFLLFLGLPVAGLFVVSFCRSVKRFRAPDYAFVLVVGLSLLLLDVTGVARGEVARVWLFLTPFPVIAAVVLLDTWPWQHRTVMIVLLALQLLVFNMFLRVVTTGVVDPPVRVRSFDSPSAKHMLRAEFDEHIELLGYDLSSDVVCPGESLELTLYWRSPAWISDSYSVFNHLRSPSNALISQQDGIPVRGEAPTTCWMPGEVLTDRYVLSIPPEAEPGIYDLVTGLYRWETGERLAVYGKSALPERALLIGHIEIPDG